ncbi:NB-ARC domain-containing protein [Tessaracoccus caeni]|uniref:NB-ARC domain-containing protein n=1 Tax=Tessaracoccus caeni TaxID=3031239 RepID=UPI0023DB43FB|nr:NB-ARC domain-containing protein [Tessaracoccus caeni]MDF1489176.1 NB-ARC domain-containing protein [Tessaracoccus caeni]
MSDVWRPWVPPTSLDELVARLRARRVEAGSPSYADLALRIAEARVARGVARSRLPGRVTVYDCFRDGRRRIDAELLLDIVRVLGADDDEVSVWRQWCGALPHQSQSDAVVSSRLGVPMESSSFIGRDREVALASRAGRILITGMGGAGKTRLAGEALRRLRAAGRLNDVLTIDVRGTETDRPARVTAVLDAIERALELVSPGDSLHDRVVAIAGCLATRRVGLLLDDVAAADQARDLLRWCRSTPMILTSRMTFDLPSYVKVIDLSPWSAKEGLELLSDRIGPARVMAEPDAAAEIVELTGGLPLAADLVAARIAERPSWTLSDHAAAMRRRSEAAQLDQAIQSAIAGSYQALSEGERQALRLLATQPCEDLSARQFAALLGASPDASEVIAEGLVRAHCAQLPAEGRIGLHDLIRAFAAARSWDEDAQSTRDAALCRLGEDLLEGAWTAAESLYAGSVARSRMPGRIVAEIPGREASMWLRSELGRIVAVSRALAPWHPAGVVDLVEAVGRFVYEQTPLAFARDFFQEAIDAANRLGDSAAAAVTHSFFTQVLVAAGDPGALDELRIVRRHAKEAGIARIDLAAMNSIGIVHGRAGELVEARDVFLEVARATDGVPGGDMVRAVVRDNAAIAMHRLGDHAGSAEEHRALIREAWASEGVPVPVIALAHANLAEPLFALGDIDGAETAAREALALAEGRSARISLQALVALALARLARGDAAGALPGLRRVQEQKDQISDPSQRANLHIALGDVLVAVGEEAEAVEHWERALGVASRASFTYEMARATLRLARRAARDDARRARRLYDEAVTLFAQSGGAEPDAAVAESSQLPRSRAQR